MIDQMFCFKAAYNATNLKIKQKINKITKTFKECWFIIQKINKK